MQKLLWLAMPVLIVSIWFVNQHRVLPIVPNTGSTTTSSTPSATVVSIDIKPNVIEQGDPAMIVLNGISSTSSISSLTFNGKAISALTYQNKPTAFVGIDLKMKTGSYPIVLKLKDGRIVNKTLVVKARQIAKAPLGIPESLGGNTPEAEKALLATLAKENAVLASIPTTNTMLWSEPFKFPLDPPIVITDPYGYTRLTGASTISHKGTDFHAGVGTKVYAMNSGVVRTARTFTDYGNTIVIDHGLGLQTLYMHLSEIDIKVGDTVKQGQIIGLSGQTGYAEAPHLHVSVKIGGVSIDPMKFMQLFDN